MQMNDRAASTYLVDGMTCGHCVASVEEEVGQLAGVADVAVDLASGRIEVSGDGFTDEQVRRAVEEAGYRIAGRA
jgi:copper chaperone